MKNYVLKALGTGLRQRNRVVIQDRWTGIARAKLGSPDYLWNIVVKFTKWKHLHWTVWSKLEKGRDAFMKIIKYQVEEWYLIL